MNYGLLARVATLKEVNGIELLKQDKGYGFHHASNYTQIMTRTIDKIKTFTERFDINYFIENPHLLEINSQTNYIYAIDPEILDILRGSKKEVFYFEDYIFLAAFSILIMEDNYDEDKYGGYKYGIDNLINLYTETEKIRETKEKRREKQFQLVDIERTLKDFKEVINIIHSRIFNIFQEKLNTKHGTDAFEALVPSNMEAYIKKKFETSELEIFCTMDWEKLSNFYVRNFELFVRTLNTQYYELFIEELQDCIDILKNLPNPDRIVDVINKHKRNIFRFSNDITKISTQCYTDFQEFKKYIKSAPYFKNNEELKQYLEDVPFIVAGDKQLTSHPVFNNVKFFNHYKDSLNKNK